MSITIGRRGFLQFVGGGAAGAATSGVTLRGLSQFNAVAEQEALHVPSGPETWAVSLCTLCPAACGLRVRKIGERAVHIQGNPLHPVNRGGLCPKGVAGLQELYHPDRLRAPLKNAGSRGNPRWTKISWEEALGTINARLRAIHDDGQAHSVVLVDRPRRNLLSRLGQRFLRAYGSSNFVTMPTGLDALQTAVYLQQGATQPVAYDWEGARYVLSFGVNLLEGWGTPATILRAFGRWRDSATGRRTKFVQVEPRFSLTAAKADEWVPLRPGTEATLALGIAYVLITEGIYDAAFVREHTFGFEDWQDARGKTHRGFRSLVTGEYRLDDVAKKTGVPEERILKLARELGRNRPAIALGDSQTSTLPGNPYAAMAVHSLNALVGSIDVPGGVLLQAESPVTDSAVSASNPPALLADAAKRLLPGSSLAGLPQAILSKKPYAVQAVLLNEVNPVFALPNGQEFAKSLQTVPFVVSFSSFLDETASLADLVLPASTGLERWQEAVAPSTFPNAVQAISPPAVAPRHATRQTEDVLLALAQSLGGPVAAALPFHNVEEYLRHEVDQLFAAQTGAVFGTTLESTWNKLQEHSGWWAPTFAKADELWAQMKEKGGWWESSYPYGDWDRALRTPSHRFEFYSQTLADWVGRHQEVAKAEGLPADDDRLCLPHQPPLPSPSADYPLLLLPIEVLPLTGGEGGHLPYLQQIAGAHLFEQWDSWLEIHPQTAHRLGIADGDWVTVESRRGRVRVRARHYTGARPDVVHLPLGYGHTRGSAWACRGASLQGLLEVRDEPLAGLPQTRNTAVKVYRS